jgi:hypothetical protein
LICREPSVHTNIVSFVPLTHDPKQHAKKLLKVFENYCEEQPDKLANREGLKCARELVRLLGTDDPDKAAIEALLAAVSMLPPEAGSAWIDLQITAKACFGIR